MPKATVDWPLLLCGPMLRTVTPSSVSVFVALKHPRKVLLTVLPPGTSTQALGSVEVETRQLGRYLHVALPTLTLVPSSLLSPGNNYRYDVSFTASGARDALDSGPVTQDLNSLGLLSGPLGLGYAENALPSFALPPTELGDLKIAHGSCRKPHGESRDVLPILDTIIRNTRSDPYARPHQLFLTGDQIYADDVAEPLLNELTPSGEALLGWGAPEQIPGLATSPAQIRPGDRAQVVHPPLTSHAASSHLMSLGEFYAMYLFAWSDALWPSTMPTFAQLSSAEQARYGEKRQEKYDAQVKSVWRFHNSLGKVRRALANVPTYMIFDDHEVTDDWFLHKEARTLAMNNDLAIRIIVNALSAYAIFQAWGNTPEQFATGQAGDRLLNALRDWRGENNSTYVTIQTAVQVPGNTGVGLRWDYEYFGSEYHVIVLDTRTKRGYPSGDDRAAPDLLTTAAMQAQISDRKQATNKRVTILVAPAPVFGHWAHESAADILGAGATRIRASWLAIDLPGETYGDRETWLVRHRRSCYENLLKALAPFERVVILSGDVHYGFTFLVHYWDERQQPEKRATFVQFTASGFKNEDFKTRGLGEAPWGMDMSLGAAGSWFSAQRAGFLGWDAPGWHLKETVFKVHVDGTPAVKRVPIDDDATILKPPQWRYRSEMVSDTRPAVARGVTTAPARSSASGWMQDASALASHHRSIAKNDQMRTVVGFNNMGIVSFDASPPGFEHSWLYAHQRLWFRLFGPNDELRPYTSHSVNLDVLSQSAGRPDASTLDTPFPNLIAWADLISLRPPAPMQKSLRTRFGGSVLDWTGHRLEAGQGAINLDYYPVRVTTLPSFSGVSVTASQLLNIIRKTLNSKVDNNRAQFSAYDATVDEPLWQSDTPLGAVVHIHIPAFGPVFDDGSVVVTAHDANRWVFSTLWTPRDHGHPVSGNREFGFVANTDGSYTFYTRGADRTTGILDNLARDQVFAGADALWTSLQDGITSYINQNGGTAVKESRHSERYPWPEVSAIYWRPVTDWVTH
jgi:hypothetical protein